MARAWLRLTLGATLFAAAAAGGVVADRALWPSGRALPGLFVGGRVQPPGERLGDWLERRRVVLLEAPAYLLADRESHATTLGQLGIELDVGKTLASARAVGRTGSLPRRLRDTVAARAGELDVPLAWYLDEDTARRAIVALAPAVYVAPVDARVDLQAHRRIPHADGAELDVEATLTALLAAGVDEVPVFSLITRPVAPAVTTQMLGDVDVERVIAAYETSYAGTGEGRAQNIVTAATYLNGVVLAPGQVLSFNQTVGERSLQRGFTWAPVIVDDELDSGLGGGVCQVASTLHAAAVFGALDVVARRSHSRPSAYTQLGLDATVIWGEVDLKLRNPFSTPIMIHAFRPTEGRIRIELLGRDPPGTVKYSYGVAKKHDFFRRVTTKSWLGERSVLRQKGRPGYEVTSVVRVQWTDGHQSERAYHSEYRPVPEVFWVGPTHDVTDLPDLPEGATRVVVDGVDESPGTFLSALGGQSQGT